MKHLQSFRYVKAIVEQGSIRAAAETMALSASALNRHIQSLEEDLGAKVFERLTKGVRLSAEGEIFFTYALHQLAGYDRLQGQIENIKGLKVGSLKLGITEDFHLGFLQRIVADLQRDNVNCDVSITTVPKDGFYSLLENRDIDLVLAVNPNIRRGLQVLHAKDVALTAFVPNGMPIGHDGMLNVYDLQGLRIATPPTTTEVSQRIVAAVERSKIEAIHHYSGSDLFDFLEFAFSPTVGLAMLIDLPERPTQVPGYKRLRVIDREVGNCAVSLVSFESYGLSFAAHSFQVLASAYLSQNNQDDSES
ncbi:MAG: LysR family transcriptional regulator [Pseudomonadota bacterium]